MTSFGVNLDQLGASFVPTWSQLGNNFGQLGLGNISNNDVLTPQFVNFIGSSKPVSLHSGMNSYCAKLDNGSIACWGRNTDGELGLGNTTNQNKPVTLSTPAGRTVSTVSLGKRFMCLSYDNGSVACVGINNENQLGQGGGGARRRHHPSLRRRKRRQRLGLQAQVATAAAPAAAEADAGEGAGAGPRGSVRYR